VRSLTRRESVAPPAGDQLMVSEGERTGFTLRQTDPFAKSPTLSQTPVGSANAIANGPATTRRHQTAQAAIPDASGLPGYRGEFPVYSCAGYSHCSHNADALLVMQSLMPDEYR
jgi:hypothetical protein